MRLPPVRFGEAYPIQWKNVQTGTRSQAAPDTFEIRSELRKKLAEAGIQGDLAYLEINPQNQRYYLLTNGTRENTLDKYWGFNGNDMMAFPGRDFLDTTEPAVTVAYEYSDPKQPLRGKTYLRNGDEVIGQITRLR